MEEVHLARRSSDIYAGNNDSAPSLGSDTGLRGHAALPAGSRLYEGEHVVHTTPAGVPLGAGGATSAIAPDIPNAPEPQPAPAPPPSRPFYKKRWFIISQIIMIPLSIALLFIILFPVVRAIVQLVIKRTTLNVDVATISDPQNTTFQLALQGYVAHTGIVSATIRFTEPIRVSWIQEDGSPLMLGTMNLTALSAKHKRAVIDQNTTFIIQDEVAFGRFASHMITAQNFTWRLQSSNLRVQALKLPVAKGLSFDKDLTLNGFNNFNGNATLQNLQLPSDNPAGGIDFVAGTELVNLSPFSLDLGIVVLALSYQNVPLGLGTSLNTIITNGTNRITLSGFLQRQTGTTELAVVSQLFTNYLNGDESLVIATGLSTLQADNSTISWLSQGLQSLNLTVPFKAPTPIDPIHSITIGDFGLAFTEDDPWGPSVDSHTVQATLQLPFGFNIAVDKIQNDFMIMKDGQPVAGLSTPLGASTSSISVLTRTNTAGTINISITDTKLSSNESDHPTFSAFNAQLTSTDKAEFRLVGMSRAVATTSIGKITLDPIKINVLTSLNGLQGLKGRTTIESVDVEGGSMDALNLGIKVVIFNPSNLELSTGDLSLQLFRDGVPLGIALLPNLTLSMGNNTFEAKSSFEANNSPQGLQTLNDFVGKKDVELSIAGFDGSTKIASLVEAFNTLSIDVTLPGMSTNLLDEAALKVLSTTGRENNVSHVTVSLVNPFSAALHITKVTSTVRSFGIPLGTIQTDTDFRAAPKSTTTSPNLDLNMNFDPSALFTLTRVLALDAGLDVGPLDGIVELGGIKYLSTTSTAPSNQRRDPLYSGFNLPAFVQAAFKKLQSDVQLTTEVTIGDYKTTLQYTQLGVPTATDNSLNLILPVLAQPIVQKIVGGSVIGIDTVIITDPHLNFFGTKLKGSITNAGPFDANIAFPSGLTVTWAGKPIGNIKIDDVKVFADVGAVIDIESQFEVADVAHLTEFTKVLLTQESFEWEISGENLTVTALGIDVSGISLSSKRVILKGFDGLKDGVSIKSFDLPSNDPAGGIHLTLEATATNPSQVGVDLNSIGFETYIGDIMIAPVASKGGVILSPGSSSALSLVGRLIPQDSPAGLSVVSQVFNNFVQGRDSNVVVRGANAGPSDVTWLNEGIRSLQVATILPNQGRFNIIKSISLNQLQLLFTDVTAYNPSTSSKSTDAAFTLPFGFPLDISALEQTLTIGFEGTSFAQLALPKAPSVTDVENRIIHLTFDNIPFAVLNNQHSTFDRFVAATTVGKTQTLHLSGSANADAKTAVGLLSLTSIDFAVDTSIEGLQGLNTRPVTVSDLDVNHGFPDHLLIKVDSALFNPSNLTIGTGDVAFSLQFQDQMIGTANINNMVIKPGNGSYPIDVHYAPRGGAVTAGRNLLQNFLQGIDVDTAIAGSMDSTPIDSLKSALSQIRLSPVKIPALHQTLIKSASLTFPLDIIQTGTASTSFTLSNPFTASINLLKVSAIATFRGLKLGTIDHVDISSNPIHAGGHSDVTSPDLPLSFNLDSVTIIQLLSLSAEENGVNLGPLVAMFQFITQNPGFKPPVTTSVDTTAPTCVSGQQFDAAGAILRTLAGLEVDLGVEISVKLDDFATDLAFDQKSVPAITDHTALFLIGAVAGPIAQHLVDGSTLAFTEANITNISDGGFDLSLVGSLTNIGPLDAAITFVEPLTVAWEGRNIAHISLPPVCAFANTGVPNYRTNARVTITNLLDFTSFAIFLLHNPSFEWTISTPKLRVAALGTVFDNVSLTKVVSFTAFNGLPGVAISNFQLPSDDPAGGIHIETDAIIPSPAQLGIDLGTVTFQSFFDGTFVGPLSGSGLFLAANAKTHSHLSGRIVPQNGADLDKIGVLFSNFLAGENQTLIAKGDSVQPLGSSQPVTWLSEAFKTLSLSVILPGQKLDVIQSIELNDLAVTIQTQDQAFAPPTSSEFTLAKYKNPFGFSLQVFEAGQSIVLNSHDVDIAELDVPKMPASGGVSTGNVVDLIISFKDQPLKSLNNAAFQMMFSQVTLSQDLELTLKGSADVSARTAIGDVSLSDIPFNVPSSLKGINAFGGVASLSNVSVAGSGGNGGSEFIIAPLTTILQNPSNISLSTVDVALPVFYQGVEIGRASINPFNLRPGDNSVATEFRYQPDNANDTVAQGFLSEFIQTDHTIPLMINGDAASTPFGSLQPALAGLELSTMLPGLNQPDFITQITITITLDTLVDNLVSVNFDVHNPLDADLVLEFVQSDSGVNGTTYASFGQSFSNFVIPPGQTVNSGDFPNVLLTQGAIASLDIIPLGVLDVNAAATIRVGQGGYEIPWLQLAQKDVRAVYNLVLTAQVLKQKAAELNATSSTISSASSTVLSPSASESATFGAHLSRTSITTVESSRPSLSGEAPAASSSPNSSPQSSQKPTEEESAAPAPSITPGDAPASAAKSEPELSPEATHESTPKASSKATTRPDDTRATPSPSETAEPVLATSAAENA